MTLTNQKTEQVSRDESYNRRITTYKELYDRVLFDILLMSTTYASYATPAKNNETEHEKMIREGVQEGADSLEDAISKLKDQLAQLEELTNLRVADDLDTANSNLERLADMAKPLGCQVEGQTNEACQFEVLQDLIDQRAGDFERLRAEEAMPKSPSESDIESEED
ncbi:MAG: hypothetical protein Q9209_001671 [Squamulea sp. 1 TL-2023]